MRRRAACCAVLLAVLLTGCGAGEVDIIMTPNATESPVVSSPQAVETADTAQPDDMVKVVDIIPGIYTDVRYATADNFTGRAIYPDSEVYLRRSTAEKLARVQRSLNAQGYSLCIWDGWRSRSSQIALWEACPDERYVSNPYTGLSGHCRGNTVDITLVTIDGEPVEMPSNFDEFGALADRDYSDVSPETAENARLLEQAMADRKSVV